eukprot:2648821-Amphidinium_carterae.1
MLAQYVWVLGVRGVYLWACSPAVFLSPPLLPPSAAVSVPELPWKLHEHHSGTLLKTHCSQNQVLEV